MTRPEPTEQQLEIAFANGLTAQQAKFIEGTTPEEMTASVSAIKEEFNLTHPPTWGDIGQGVRGTVNTMTPKEKAANFQYWLKNKNEIQSMLNDPYYKHQF